MVKTLLSLTIIGAVCGTLLVGTHALTSDGIDRNREARARALMAVMLGAELSPDLDIQNATFGRCAEWVFQRVTVQGYAGEIRLLSLWRASDTLTLRVTQHRETPGIGDFIDHERAPWLPRMDGMRTSAIARVDNVSGATITTNAIRNAAELSAQGVEAYCRG